MIHVRSTTLKHLETEGHFEKGYAMQKSPIITWDYKKDTNRKHRHHPTPPATPRPKSTNQKKPKGNTNASQLWLTAWAMQGKCTAVSRAFCPLQVLGCSQSGSPTWLFWVSILHDWWLGVSFSMTLLQHCIRTEGINPLNKVRVPTCGIQSTQPEFEETGPFRTVLAEWVFWVLD